MRVAIVNDVPGVREMLQRIVCATGEHTIAWMANEGAEAVAKCATTVPDLILMDMAMPGMDGVAATRQIMAESPCPILIVTATVNPQSAMVYAALGAGALDAMVTPPLEVNGPVDRTHPLLAKISLVRRLLYTQPPESPKTPAIADRPRARISNSMKNAPLIAIGASAGGPAALASILHDLPPKFGGAIVIVQHVNAQFSEAMARWLNGQSHIPVRVACDGDVPTAGTALVAGTDDHLVLASSTTLGYQRDTDDAFYRPSIDVFFQSISANWRGTVVGVILTGMGRDGARGLKRLRDGGAITIAQDRATSVVYGMPKAAVELGAAAEVLPLNAIGNRLARIIRDIPEATGAADAGK